VLKDDQIKSLMLACELEKSLAELYIRFGEHYPEFKELWALLIQEEQWHAESVRRLYRMTYEGRCTFEAGEIRCAAIQSIVDYVRETIDATALVRFTPVHALEIVHDLEKSLIEQDIFAHFRVTPEFSETLRLLDAGTRKHAQLAKSALDGLRAQAARGKP
jgi:hypothetical protein